MQIFFSIACVASVVSIYMQGREFIEQLRFRREDTSMIIENDEATRKLRKHTKRLVSTKRTMNLVSCKLAHLLEGHLLFLICRLMQVPWSDWQNACRYSLLTMSRMQPAF
jgi:hypothetical protein